MHEESLKLKMFEEIHFYKALQRIFTAAGREVPLEKVLIKLNNMEDVQGFVSILSNFEGDFNLSKGRITVDAKSILGVCSLDLSGPLELWIFKDEAQYVIEKIRPYMLAG